MVRAPRQIKVGNKTYKVVLVKSLENAAGAPLLGLHAPSVRTIFIEKNLPPAHLAEVVLHELMHAVATDYYGLVPVKSNVEEFWINNLSLGVVKVFKDNPHLFKWWSSLMSEVKGKNTNNA